MPAGVKPRAGYGGEPSRPRGRGVGAASAWVPICGRQALNTSANAEKSRPRGLGRPSLFVEDSDPVRRRFQMPPKTTGSPSMRATANGVLPSGSSRHS